LLLTEKKALSRREIAIKLECNPDKISELLRKMLNHKEIQCLELDRHQAKEKFKEEAPVRRLRLYFA